MDDQDIDDVQLTVTHLVDRSVAWDLIKFCINTFWDGWGELTFPQMTINQIRQHHIDNPKVVDNG